jgi:ferredoxin
MCALTAAGVFDQDPNDGRVVLLEEHPTAANASAARQAVALCPSGALSFHHDDHSDAAHEE